MDWIRGIIVFILVFSFIVVIHECGHFLIARHYGVYCHEFSIGMGPAIYQHQFKQTLFSVRLLPLGGYVRMAGEEDVDLEEEWLKEVPEGAFLQDKKVGQRAWIMAGGIIMNFLLAFVVIMGIHLGLGQRAQTDLTIVEVQSQSPAQEAGIQKGDRIVAINGHKITSYEQIAPLVQAGKLEVSVKRDGQTLTKKLDVKNKMGIVFGTKLVTLSITERIMAGFDQMKADSMAIFGALANLVQGKNLDQLSGPVGIVQVTKQASDQGLLVVLRLMGLLSLNLGIFNALPLPALDGGRLIILLIEKLLGRKPNEKWTTWAIVGSFGLLLALMVLVTIHDVIRLW